MAARVSTLQVRMVACDIDLALFEGPEWLTQTPRSPCVPILSRGRGFTITPMEEGPGLAGTVEIGGLDMTMNEDRAYVLLPQAKALLPGLEASDYSTWMGFRPSFPDSLPVIDEAPGCRGLFLAFGHGRTAMTGGAPTGRLVKQLVSGEFPDVALAPFSATRFH